MFGVKPSKKTVPQKHVWKNSQQSQIDDYQKADVALRAAFPGSRLFNDILVPLDSKKNNTYLSDTGMMDYEASVPDVSSIVYSYCCDLQRDNKIENAIVIDTDVTEPDASIITAIGDIVNRLKMDHVVLLGQATYGAFAQKLKSVFSGSSQLSMIEPDWSSTSAMHAVYRQASCVLFLNTTRVLDAAYTGCDCKLMTSKTFREDQMFSILHERLLAVDCQVIDESGNVIEVTAKPKSFEFILARNSVSSVERALRLVSSGNTVEPIEDDWLAVYLDKDQSPLIKFEESSRENINTRWRDRITRISRKLSKLRDDPQAFFSDAKNPLLRSLGSVFWFRAKQGRQ